jgi:hypothetical protein
MRKVVVTRMDWPESFAAAAVGSAGARVRLRRLPSRRSRRSFGRGAR